LKHWSHAALSLLTLLILLPACSSMRPVDVDEPARVSLYQTKSEQLAGISNWKMVGRLGVKSDQDGGSGHFSWKKNAGNSQMDFHGALGRGAWRLVADAGGATLELADGAIHRADSIDQLVRLQVGWEIPVDNLSWWVRGLVAPGEFKERLFDENGNLSSLVQDGWTIEFSRYGTFDGISLPVRLTARQADWKVKLAIRNWELADKKGSYE